MEVKYKEFEIKSFEEFILELKKRTFKDQDKTTRLYRGHRETDWLLLPKIGRPEYQNSTFLDSEKDLLNEFKLMSIQHNN